MSYEEYKRRMKEQGITWYREIIPKLREVPRHCYKCGELKYEDHKCREGF